MIHLIGNSHVSSFSNMPVPPARFSYESSYFIPVWLGAVTAYNFYENHRDFISNYIKNSVKKNDYATFIAGEVDCRIHIPLQADKQKKSDSEIVEECVKRFKKLFELTKNLGINTFVFGTHATTTEPHSMENQDRPIYGDVKRRNNICLLWNKYLELMAKDLGIVYASIYDKLVDSNNITIMDYMADYCHLQSPKIYTFILEELKSKGIIS